MTQAELEPAPSSPLLIRDHTEMKTGCLLCTWLSLVQWPDTSSQILIGHCVSMGSHYQRCDMKYPWPLSAAVVLDVLLAVCTCCKYSLSVESHDTMHNPQRHLNVNSSKCQEHTHTHTLSNKWLNTVAVCVFVDVPRHYACWWSHLAPILSPFSYPLSPSSQPNLDCIQCLFSFIY